MPDPIYLEWGRVEFGRNEITIVSTVDDPPAVRLAVSRLGSMGKLSFNYLRPDGVQEEMVLIQGVQDERYRGTSDLIAEFGLNVRQPGANDQAMKRVLTIRHDGVQFHVPTNAGGAGHAASDRATYFTSPGGKYWGVVQDDGSPRFVIYEGTPDSPSRAIAVFEGRRV